MLVDVLAESQNFIREAENNHFCVSLRDVHRCIILIKWFGEMICKREEVKSPEKKELPQHLRKYELTSRDYNEKPVIKSIVLALAHCYLSRLPTDELRRRYREKMITLFCGNGTMMGKGGKEKVDDFSAIVRMEEEDYLDRMELPPGTARNAALRENVFVMLVCILNKIPVFVVGKPGCSKSLSIQLIRSNLRGRDSKDPLFLKLPQLYVVSYQGSESSTSEGIIKVFDKARKYKSHDKDGNVLPVVLLDEVGLAENSKYNPLKVLHSLLEPGDGKLPEVAVVGISNWSLDAAKMNRAIHLSRPEPTKEDLYETGHSLLHANAKYEGDYDQGLGEEELQCLAESYFEYQSEQKYANFHGLRDYYSLIKSISLNESSDLQDINLALQRNFGGIPGELTNIQKIFLDKLKKSMLSSGVGIISVTKLIQENLVDPLARHLMLITSGDSAIGILNQSLKDLQKETITIFGSRFEEDLSEDYNYRILSRIILCMERDCILILRDLESIYGSLYDMLNQNYAVVGKRKNCRVALGAYSNPMCQVNDGFRCIVLTDHHKVDFSDPPFLNRFEKQLLRFSDVLNEKQRGIITELRRWVKDVSTIQGLESHFKESDMFIGFHEDTLPSLVLLHSHETEESDEEIMEKCKDDLMWVAAPDGILRAQKCNHVKVESEEVKNLSDRYFKKPIHQGFASFIETMTSDQENSFLTEDEIGSKTIVMTFSNIHTDISKCLGDTITNQTERLSAYKSEKQLAERVNNFWSGSDAELLVLQCKPELDGEHLLLARSIIEDKRSSYGQTCRETELKQKRKHVCIVVHVQRGMTHNDVPWQFSFLCGWKQVFLDVLEAPPVSLNEIRTESVQKLLMTSIWPLRKIAENELLWCFTCIKYMRNQRPLDSILSIAKKFLSSEKVFQVIEKLVLQWVNDNADEMDEETGVNESWQVKVACDRESLINSSTLYGAMEHHVSRLVREPLAKIIYFLEKENAWPPHVHDDDIDANFEEIWCDLLLKDAIFKLSEIPKPLGAETYILDSLCLDLRLPFSQVVMRRVDGVKDFFLEDYAQAKEDDSNLNNSGELTEDAQKQQVKRFSEIILKTVPEIKEFPISCCDSYMSDLFDIMSADFSTRIERHQRVSAVKAAFISHVKHNLHVKEALQFYVQLHVFVWIHKEKILDQLRMVDCCQPFVSSKVLAHLAEGFLLSNVFVHDIGDAGCPNEEADNLDDETEEDDGSEDESKTNQKSEAQSYIDKSEENENAQSEEDAPAEESNGSNEEEQEGECFNEMLVTVYCEAMLPSQETVQERNSGPESWIRNASLLLSLAFKISDQSPAFHFLRLCVDFAKIFLNPGEELFPLYILNEIGYALKPGYLDTDESFQKITEDLIKPLEEKVEDESIKCEALQKFSALFYGRCIDTNVDTCGARPIVEQVLSLDRADLVLMMGPVIRHLLVVEEMDSPGIFVDIMTIPGKIEKCPCLQNIDEVFKYFFEQELIHHDSYAAVMIADLIQSLLKFEDNYSIEDIDSSDCELLKRVNGATKVLSESNEDNCGLVVLSAVAFLRAFFTMLSRFIDDKKAIVMKEDSQYSHVMNEINSLLSAAATGDARRRSLQFFFLKQLYQKMSLFALRKLCCENETLPSIKSIWANVQTIAAKAEFVSPCKLPEYQRVKVAYYNLIEEDETDMLAIVNECQDSSNLRLAVLGVLVNMVYLKRTVKKLTDKEERLADWFAEKITQFGSPLKELLQKITGRKDFYCPQLQLSPESSVEEVEIALLILHVSCVIVSGDHGEQSPIYQYFSNPEKCKGTFILGTGPERMYHTFENCQPVHGPSPLSCPCGLRVMFKKEEEENRCPSCKDSIKPVSGKTGDSNGGTTTINSEKASYSPVPAKEMSQWDIRMENMNPAVFRALHLIVHASLYAGVAVQISTKDDLSSLLNLEENQSSGEENGDPVQFCFDHVTTDLSNLVSILECKKEIAFKVMHLVVEKCTHLIRGEPLGNNACRTLKQRSQWEVMFSKLTQPILREALGSSKQLKQEMRMQQNLESEESSIQNQILELDEYPSKPTQQNQQLKRLFRVTKQPTFTEFRATFVNSPKDIQENHSFLSLFFAKFEELTTIGNLYHILKWARLVSSALTHRISRKEAQLKSIDDFIHGHILEQPRTQEETDNQKKLFENFKNVWNAMRQLIDQELDQKETEMPRLKKTDNIAYCLTESDSGVYLLTAIRILVSLQNSFLDEMLPLSALLKHPALRFLEKDNNCSGISSVSIQQVKEKEIINFQWSDGLFKYAQNNPEFGHGEEIIYDFERIEIELANKLAFGKCHLTGSLNRFIFAEEIFHSCAPLLSEIRGLFFQSPNLPDEVRQGLSSLKKRRIQEARDLLQHIEIFIYLLKFKMKTTFEKNMPLETFAKEWLSMLPSPFPVKLLPQPSSSIKLMHITVLYEALEDLLADGAIEGLPDQFREELTEEAKDTLSCLVEKDDGLKLPSFLNALRRFVFRYLSSEKFQPDENTELNSSLKEPSLWSPGEPPDPEVIPKELTLQNINAVVMHLQELDKVSI